MSNPLYDFAADKVVEKDEVARGKGQPGRVVAEITDPAVFRQEHPNTHGLDKLENTEIVEELKSWPNQKPDQSQIQDQKILEQEVPLEERRIPLVYALLGVAIAALLAWLILKAQSQKNYQ